jgi:hypothetical protein
MAAEGRVRPVSDQFLALLRTEHLVASSVELRWPGQTTWVPIPVVGGSVTMDRTAAVQRAGSVTIPWSLEAGSTLGVDLRLLPFGGYARVYRGLRYPDGTLELCRLGTFRVESVSWRADETASLELADRMAQVRDEPFRLPYMPTPKPTITRTGTVTNGSNRITGLSQTSDLTVGMAVSGPLFPPGTVIVSIDSSSQVTVNTTLATSFQRNAHFTKGRTYLDRMGDKSGIEVGMTVTSPIAGELPAGTTVAAVYIPARNGRDVVLSTAALVTSSRPLNFFVGTGTTASLSITFGGNVTAGQAAGEIVYPVFFDTIAYQILWDPPYELTNTAYTGSRVDALLDLAKAASGYPYFDANGDFVFTQPPTTDNVDPVWTVDAGATGVLVSDVEALDRTGIYNGVLVQGQGDPEQPPIQATVVDDDDSSPTRWGGPYGRVVRIEQSSVVKTVQQAQDAARALLDARLGLSRSVTLTAAPNPALEAADVIEVVFDDGRSELHVVDTIRLGLEPTSAQELATRSRWKPGDDDWTPLPPPSRAVYVGDAAWEVVKNARVAQAVGV